MICDHRVWSEIWSEETLLAFPRLLSAVRDRSAKAFADAIALAESEQKYERPSIKRSEECGTVSTDLVV